MNNTMRVLAVIIVLIVVALFYVVITTFAQIEALRLEHPTHTERR